MGVRYRRIFWTLLLLINMAVVSVVGYLHVSGKDFSVSQKENSHLIGLSYMTMNNEFYKIMSEEINARIEAEGDRMVMRDPALDVERQITQIEEMLTMGIDVLVLTPVDSEKIVDVLRKAKKQGVYIVVLDTGVSDQTVANCTITSDNYGAGVAVGEYFLSKKQQARVVVMTHQAAQSGRNRVQGFLDTVAGSEDIKIVKSIECEGQTEIAMPGMRSAIETGTDFDTVFCLNDLATVGVIAALEEKGMLDKVGVYGVDGSPDAKALIHEGMMQATAAQFPSEIGKTAAENIYRLLEGEPVEKMTRIPVRLVDKENVDSFGTDRWQ